MSSPCETCGDPTDEECELCQDPLCDECATTTNGSRVCEYCNGPGCLICDDPVGDKDYNSSYVDGEYYWHADGLTGPICGTCNEEFDAYANVIQIYTKDDDGEIVTLAVRYNKKVMERYRWDGEFDELVEYCNDIVRNSTYISTGWRGYEIIKPKMLVPLHEDVLLFGENERLTNQFIEQATKEHDPLFVVLTHTGNVFSRGLDVYVVPSPPDDGVPNCINAG